MPDPDTIQVGAHVADFTLRDATGKERALSSLAGENGIVLGFLHGTYCAACLQQLTRANRYSAPLDAHKVGFVWILNDSPENIFAFSVGAYPPPRFQMVPDSTPSVSHHFGLYAETPHGGGPQPSIVYLDPDLTVRYLFVPEDPHTALNLDALLDVVREVSGEDQEGDLGVEGANDG
jgi:peroxiredoxin